MGRRLLLSSTLTRARNRASTPRSTLPVADPGVVPGSGHSPGPAPAVGRVLAAVLTVVVATVLLVGCAAVGGLSPGQEEEQVDVVDVAGRAGLAEVVARYEQMQRVVRERLDAELGPFAWEQPRPDSRSPCGANGPGGDRMYLGAWRFDGNVPDRDWPRARDIVLSAAAEYGFTTPGMQIDTPGHHRSTAGDPALGALFDFRSQVNTIMQVTTGCHPPA